MPNTPVEVRAPSGLALSLELYPYGSDTLANPGGDSLVEADNRRGIYVAAVSEPLVGWHTAHVKLGAAVLAVFDVYLEDDSEVHRCEDALARLYAAGISLSASETIYPADIQLTVDGAHARDEYTVTWFANGTVLTAGITAPTIEVVRRADGAPLVEAGTSLVPIADTGALKYDESTNRVGVGEAVLVTVTATIDGSVRTWRRIVTRDAE